MAEPETYPVGQAPWETAKPESFPVGKAPWELAPPPITKADADAQVPDKESLLKKFGKMGLKALPAAGMVGGGIAGAAGGTIAGGPGLGTYAGGVLGAGAGAGAGKAAEDYLEEKLGIEKPKSTTERVMGPVKEAGEAAAMEAIPVGPAVKMVAESPVGAAIKSAGSKVVDSLGSMAAKKAVQAIGYTGAKLEKAAASAGKTVPEYTQATGKELLEGGLVKAGASPSSIAKDARAALDTARNGIDESLTALDKKGVTVDTNEIVQGLQSRIDNLKKSASSVDHKLAGQLEGEIETLQESAKNRGTSMLPPTEAEKVKRSYDQLAKDWSDPESGQLGKEMYQVWRRKVEDVATKYDPDIAKKFLADKKAYGTLAPIEGAAARREAQLQSHPSGGFLDMTTAGPVAFATYEKTGSLTAAVLAGTGALVGRRVIAPRIPATTAATANAAANILKTVPKYGQMAVDNPQAFKAAALMYADHNAEDRAAKGPEKWAADGYDNLLQHGADISMIGQARQDPKMKDLLVQASEEKPGSKAMDNIVAKMKAKMGSK